MVPDSVTIKIDDNTYMQNGYTLNIISEVEKLPLISYYFDMIIMDLAKEKKVYVGPLQYTIQELKTYGLAINLMIRNGDDISYLLRDLSEDEQKQLINKYISEKA